MCMIEHVMQTVDATGHMLILYWQVICMGLKEESHIYSCLVLFWIGQVKVVGIWNNLWIWTIWFIWAIKVWFLHNTIYQICHLYVQLLLFKLNNFRLQSQNCRKYFSTFVVASTSAPFLTRIEATLARSSWAQRWSGVRPFWKNKFNKKIYW